ncbi:MAG: hypothetical protein ACRDHE_03645, partial [Ktedonobacterales bacterium]
MPARPDAESRPPSDAPAGPDAAAFVVSPPTSERASPYRFVGERRMLPREAHHQRPTNGHEPNGSGGGPAPEPRGVHPHVTGIPTAASSEEAGRRPRGYSDQTVARGPDSQEDAATSDDDESDEAWT